MLRPTREWEKVQKTWGYKNFFVKFFEIQESWETPDMYIYVWGSKMSREKAIGRSVKNQTKALATLAIIIVSSGSAWWTQGLSLLALNNVLRLSGFFFFFWRGVRLLENIVWKHQKHETVLELRLSVSYSLVERNSTVLRGKSWKPKIPQCSMHLYARHWAWG